MTEFFHVSDDHRLMVDGRPFSGSRDDLNAIILANKDEWNAFVAANPDPRQHLTTVEGIVHVRMG